MAARALPFTAGRAPVGRLRDSIIRLGEMSEAHPDMNEVMPNARIVARGKDGIAMGLDENVMVSEIRGKRWRSDYLYEVLSSSSAVLNTCFICGSIEFLLSRNR